MTYFASLIPFYAWIVLPLFVFLKKNTAWAWGNSEQHAFDLAKRALVSSPLLAYPIVDVPYRVYTDASEAGLSGILQQVQPIAIKDTIGTRVYERCERAFKDGKPPPRLCTPTDKDKDVVAGGDNAWNTSDWMHTVIVIERVIAYWSRILRKEEHNYSATEREALALKEALVKFQVYLEGAQFTAITDQAAFTWSTTFHHVNQRLLKWGMIYSAYPGLKIIHRAGRVHDNADSLLCLLYRVPKSDNPLPEDETPIILSSDQDAIQNFSQEISTTLESEVKEVMLEYIMTNLDDFPSQEVLRTEVSLDNHNLLGYGTSFSHNILTSIDSSESKRFLDEYQRDPHFSKVFDALRKNWNPLNSPYPEYTVEDNGTPVLSRKQW
jgi:hypothetical protein